ncbi:MAG: transcriptional repressor [Aestuariivirga sp.]
MSRPSRLPVHPSELVLKALKRSRKPLSAYELLEKLQQHGVKGPPIVYRALDGLIQKGVVHKIKALGTFVACNCAKDHHHALSVLTVCGDCKSVAELHDHAIIDHLEDLRGLGVPLQDHAVIELPIICEACTK